MPRLLHHSVTPLRSVRSLRSVEAQWASWKPQGLWVSVEGSDDWAHWCRASNFRVDRFEHTAEIVLQPDAKIRRIKTAKDLQRFHNAYSTGGVFWRDIDWAKVAKRWQGIIIAPYQWTLRHGLGWYYTWDVASGCIWDVSAVKHVRQVDFQLQAAAA